MRQNIGLCQHGYDIVFMVLVVPVCYKQVAPLGLMVFFLGVGNAGCGDQNNLFSNTSGALNSGDYWK